MTGPKHEVEDPVRIKVEDFVAPNPKKPKYICGECGKAHRDSKTLGSHFIREHLGDWSFCLYCTDDQQCPRHNVYYNWRTKSRHRRPHQCPQCPESFVSYEALRSHHKEIHESQGAYRGISVPRRVGDIDKLPLARREELKTQQLSLFEEARQRHSMLDLLEDGRVKIETSTGPGFAAKTKEESGRLVDDLQWPPALPAQSESRMRIGFVLQSDHRMNLDFVLQD